MTFGRAAASFHVLPVWQRWAIAGWAALVMGVSARTVIEPVRSHTVYPIYVVSAERWSEGEDLYGYHSGIDVYRYHPGFAAAFRPWLMFPERLGGWLWRAFNLGVFLFGLIRFGRDVMPRRLSANQWAGLLIIPLPLALHSYNNAQANLLLIGLLMLGAAELSRGRLTPAALYVGAATLLKAYPIALGLLFCLTHGRRFSGRYGLVLLGGFMLPFLAQSPEYVAAQYRRWIEVSGLDDRLGASLDRCTRDAYMVCRVWLTEPPRWLYRAVQITAAGLLAALAFRCSRRTVSAEAATLAFHSGCLWMVLLGPATESCTYTLLGPTLAAVLVTVPPAGRSRSAWGLLIISASLFCMKTLAGALPAAARPDGLALQPIAGLLLATVVLAEVGPLGRNRLGRAEIRIDGEVPSPMRFSSGDSGRRVPEGTSASR